jgi:ketosteroid isomerase-like protein
MYDAFSRGHVEAILGLAAPDVVVYQSPSVPWGGRRSGAEGLQQFLGSLTSTIRSAVETGELYDDGDGHVWTVTDGLVQRFESYIDVAAMRRALDAVPARAGTR